ncbi:MAG TPA: phosphatase PAP2 family protein [Acidimicrobiales bacterium]|nr:phosphatase PAP2 family protein [Acidimicrobiales bacterium]
MKAVDDSPDAPATLLDEESAEPRAPAARPLRWWKEVVIALVFYGVYSAVRNMQGSATVSAEHAFNNAKKVIDLERWLGLYREREIQSAFIDSDLVMTLWNVFYGTLHFIVTIFVLVLLFRRFPIRYAKWRNALAATTGLALIGFAFYPLMPPRLLPPSYGFVDSLAVFGTPWSFDSGAMHKISNQYAAMPSLHFAWALWCGCALVAALRHWATKLVGVLYPVGTLAAIVITANHFIIDAVAGAAVLGVGWLLGTAITNGRLWPPSRFRRGVEPTVAPTAAA